MASAKNSADLLSSPLPSTRPDYHPLSVQTSTPPKEESASSSMPSSPYHSVPESGEALGVGLSPKEQDVHVQRRRAPPERILSWSFDSKAPDSPRRMSVLPEKTPPPSPDGFETLKDSKEWVRIPYRGTISTVMFMSCAASLGALLRIVLAQLFGEECRNPGTVGWLASGSPLCVTADGQSERQGDIVFADLPANILGCFIMGMMQTGNSLDLPVNVPVAWASPKSWFQSWHACHLAIRTGFCGSLTTFSSWNSEMVVIIYGTGLSQGSQLARALFGYLIGMETALGSFVFGKQIALWIHRKAFPVLALEADAIRERRSQGVHINLELPEFERRYLPNLDMELEPCDPTKLKDLEKWRASTVEYRRVGNELLPRLQEIERCALVLGEDVGDELRQVARKVGWDVHALETWVWSKNMGATPQSEEVQTKITKSCNFLIATPLFITTFCLLALGLIFFNEDTAYSHTRRTMCYAALLAPPGALLRWQLSKLNGKLAGELSWLPVGTFSANLIGCIVSMAVISSETRIDDEGEMLWVVTSLRAVKIGFAGSLTTVSTYIAEVSSFMHLLPQKYYAYIYASITLIFSCIFSVAIYGWIV